MFPILESVLQQLSNWAAPYRTEIAMTIVATLLVVYGDVVNKHIKRFLAPHHFVLRTSIFVLICAFGYGALILFVTPWVASGLAMLPYTFQGLTSIGIFLVLGYLAENRRYI